MLFEIDWVFKIPFSIAFLLVLLANKLSKIDLSPALMLSSSKLNEINDFNKFKTLLGSVTYVLVFKFLIWINSSGLFE